MGFDNETNPTIVVWTQNDSNHMDVPIEELSMANLEMGINVISPKPVETSIFWVFKIIK